MSRKIRNALIMAAGRGMRLAPLTDTVPKPMVQFQGSTLIARGIGGLLDQVPRVHITVGYKKAMLAQHVIELGAATVLNTEGQGNAWWIYHTLLANLDEPIYVLTCDNVVSLDFDLLEKNYFSLGAPPCMLVPVRPVTGLEGDFIFRNGSQVTRLDRQLRSDIYCSGVQILNPRRIAELTEACDDFYSVWAQLISQGMLHVSDVYPDKWISIDTFEQLRHFSESAV
ncbi:MAG: NDP-sugar synthase [Bacteriovoracia bacterium]